MKERQLNVKEKTEIPHCRNRQKYHTVEIVPKSNRKIVESGKIDTHDTQIHNL